LASQAKILRAYVITFCSQANVITFPYKRDPSSISAGMNYLQTSKGHGIASPEWPASGGDHISTDSDSRLCTDDSPAAAAISACMPLQKGPRPRLPTGGSNKAIKAKELEARRRKPPLHRWVTAASARLKVLAPVFAKGVRTSKNTTAAPVTYDAMYDPPVWSAAREKPWVWPTCTRRDRRPCGERAATPRPSSRRQRRRRRRSHPCQGIGHAVAGDTRSRPASRTQSSPPLHE
jgi:hypothetical protein